MSHKIQSISKENRPREKALTRGFAALTDTELIAIILRSGGKNISVVALADKLLTTFGSVEKVMNAPLEQLTKHKNIGTTKAITLRAVYELHKRISTNTCTKRKIAKPKDVFELVHGTFYKKEQEHLYLISLDTKNNVIATDLISVGTINETLLPSREIFRQALLRNAVNIILAHNHPSNDATPSPQDIFVTEKIAQAAVGIGIKLLDHIIVTDNNFISLNGAKLPENYKNKGGE